jgi:hypothetical protein
MIRFAAFLLAALAAASPLTAAQLASSPNYQLLADDLAGGGGGACSVGFAMVFASEPLAGDPVASIGFSASLGFLAANDPKPTNAPVVFGVTPDCGPITGGIPVTITGVNFTNRGAGPSIAAAIDGSAVSGLVVVSDTTITALTPVGTPGAKNVDVTSLYGIGTLTGGYEYSAGLIPYGSGTPGCLGPQTMSAASCPYLDNPAFTITCTNVPPLTLGLGLVTDSPDFVGTDVFGLGILLHIDFFLATPTEVYSFDMLSDASNFGTVTIAITNTPSLIGKNYFAQSIWVETACVLPTAANLSSSRGLQIVIEP